MRTVPSPLVALFALAMTSPVFADDTIAGTYEVKFEEAGSTCSPKPETFSKGKVAIAVKKTSLTVKFDALYQMVGATQKNGNISAKTTKLVGTAVGGLSARYSVTGHVEGGTLALVLNAQYVRQDTYRPYCTQAWNV
ncbi:MAG TPA: hypothetical protein VLB44_18325, partial [Kofleriaceae bacterium]|nr:hypothetical protein [Kofleriaceae bacterium]